MSNTNSAKSYDLFISYYSKTGRDFARSLKKGLLDFDLAAFLDEEDIPKSIQEDTDEWRKYVDDAIAHSSNFVLVMTLGFNKRQEVARELKIAFASPAKKFFARFADLSKDDLTIVVDGKPVDLTKYENLFFNNDNDLLRRVIAALLGKTGQPKEPIFMSESRKAISSEGLEFKKTDGAFVEIVIGATNETKEWLPVNPQSKMLVSWFPCYSEIEVRRAFFESKSNDRVYFKVQTNGLFHVVLKIPTEGDDQSFLYYDAIFYQVAMSFLFYVRLLKFYKVEGEQSLLIVLRNVGGKTVSFNSWEGRLYNYSFTKSTPEIQFNFTFYAQDDWKKTAEILLKFYRELCTETGCLGITDATIKSIVWENIRHMQELRTEYSGESTKLSAVDITAFGLI